MAVTKGGESYVNPVVSVSDGNGHGAVLVAKASASGGIASVAIKTGGTGYAHPTAVVQDPTGSGAVLAVTVSGGAITGITVSAAGTAYSNPAVLVYDAQGVGATFTVTLAPLSRPPACVAYFQQRRVFGCTEHNPLGLEFSQAGNYHNMNVSSPGKADDAISRTIAEQRDPIHHLVPMQSLIVLTGGAELAVSAGSQSDTVTPDAMQVRPQSFHGSSTVPPIVIGNQVLFIQAMGSVVRDLGYSFQSDSFAGNDLTVLAHHLFEGHAIVDWAYCAVPHFIIWAVRDDGVLLGLTYLREQEVWAWHQHTTDGAFESVCAIAEGLEHALYAVVRRTLNGQAVRTVERLHTRRFATAADTFFVDCGRTYSGAPVTTVGGLAHLEGCPVAVLADGHVVDGLTVSSGAITLPRAAGTVHVGLPIVADLAPVEPDGQPTAMGKRKRVVRAVLRVEKTRGMKVGPSAARLVEPKPANPAAWGQPTALITDDVPVLIDPSWGPRARLLIRQTDPLPVTVLSLAWEMDVGG